jgi:cephalosporin-C deacetylase-like acetyl esterase
MENIIEFHLPGVGVKNFAILFQGGKVKINRSIDVISNYTKKHRIKKIIEKDEDYIFCEFFDDDAKQDKYLDLAESIANEFNIELDIY